MHSSMVEGKVAVGMLLEDKVATFLAVAREGSLSRAGRSLFLSPVSVKKQMDAFEREMGVTLFVRGPRGTVLTEAGRGLAQDLANLASLADDMVRRVRETTHSGPVIHLGTSLMRPCKPLVDIIAHLGPDFPFRLEVVPFEDNAAAMDTVMADLGQGPVDCFVGPCGSQRITQACGVLALGTWECCVAVSRNDPLARRDRLSWEDLAGHRLMLLQRGDVAELDRLRDDIVAHHPQITIVDMPHFYDPDAFNECGRSGVVMETLDAWADIHPNVATVPMDWDYCLPYGLIYPKHPDPDVAAFVGAVAEAVAGQGGGRS